MARRSTKAGPARSRRRPDPSTRKNPSQAIAPINVLVINTGPGGIAVNVEIKSPIDGTDWVGTEWNSTNVLSTAFFVDSAGTQHPLVLTGDPGPSGYAYDILAGLPAGNGTVVIPALDAAIRSKFGDWIGSGWQPHSVT